MDHLAELTDFVVSTTPASLPADVRTATRRFLLDTLAVMLGGSTAPGVAEVLEEVREWGGAPQSTIAVFGDRVPATHAALVNAVMAHALDFDDTFDEAGLHANVCVVPALLAAAETVGADGATVLAAHAIGLEVACRMALAAGKAIKYGWLPTTLFGSFGATAAVAKVLGLSGAQTRHAFGIMYSQAAGNRQGLLDGALTKRIQPGFYAQAAVLSASLARRGITGARRVVDGPYGLYPLYVGDGVVLDELTRGLGRDFHLLRVALKPYPCCRATHEAIDAALELATEERVDPATVSRVRVSVASDDVLTLVGQPLTLRDVPQVDAQFSLQYTVAAALTRGRVGIGDFEEKAIREVAILDLARRVDVAVEPEHAVTVEVTGCDGRRRARTIKVARGHPSRPLGADDLLEKVRDCGRSAARPFTEDRLRELARCVESLETLPDIATLTRLLVQPPA